MILIMELPHQGKPTCWFAFDEQDFVRKTELTLRSRLDGVIHAEVTPRELLAQRGAVPDTATAVHADIRALAEEHGWDTALYRADYLVAPGHYQLDAIDDFMAYVAALAHTLHTCRMYPDEETAVLALENDPLYAGREGFAANMALRQQLIALEALSDDL